MFVFHLFGILNTYKFLVFYRENRKYLYCRYIRSHVRVTDPQALSTDILLRKIVIVLRKEEAKIDFL